MDLDVKIDSTGLNRGLATAAQYTKRSLPEMVNTAGYWVAVNAKNALPFVTPEKIDSELSVITVPVIGKRGKVLKRKKQFSGGMSPLQRSQGAPLAALIVQARANKNSNYNILTNQRYALSGSPFKGVSRAAGRAAMAALVDKMIKLRHRSGKFLVAGAIPAIQKLYPYSVQKFIRGGIKSMDGARAFYGAHLGDAKPAVNGQYTCFATLENDVGTEGKNAASFNRALMQFGIPAYQNATDNEGRKNAEYALGKYAAELKQQVEKDWK